MGAMTFPLNEGSITRLIRYSILTLAALAHLFLLLYFKFNITREAAVAEPEAEVIKLVDFQEYIPPPPPRPQPKKEVIEVSDQPSVAEEIIEVDEEVVEVEEAPPVPGNRSICPSTRFPESRLSRPRKFWTGSSIRPWPSGRNWKPWFMWNSTLIRPDWSGRLWS